MLEACALLGRGDETREGRVLISRQQHAMLELYATVLLRTPEQGRGVRDDADDDELLPSPKRRKVRTLKGIT